MCVIYLYLCKNRAFTTITFFRGIFWYFPGVILIFPWIYFDREQNSHVDYGRYRAGSGEAAIVAVGRGWWRSELIIVQPWFIGRIESRIEKANIVLEALGLIETQLIIVRDFPPARSAFCPQVLRYLHSQTQSTSPPPHPPQDRILQFVKWPSYQRLLY